LKQEAPVGESREMESENIKADLKRLNAEIQNSSFTPDDAWRIAERFWDDNFPSRVSPDQRNAVWQIVKDYCNTLEPKVAAHIIEILEWPASGAEPTWN
jgi:hypothetical protein